MSAIPLDNPTIQAVTALLVVVGAAALLLFMRLYPQVPGLRYWGWSCLAAVSAIALALGRPLQASLLNIGLTNIAVLSVAALMWAGCRAYVGLPTRLGLVYGLLVLPVLLLVLWLQAQPGLLGLSLTMQGLALGGLYVGAGWTLWRHSTLRRPAVMLFIVVVVLHGLFVSGLRPWLMHLARLSSGQAGFPPIVSLEATLFFWMIIITTVMLVTEHVNRDLQRLAEVDELTQTFNRRAFLLLLDKACAQASRAGSSLAVLVMDLDDFKAINDRYGHHVGDRVLRHCTRCIQAHLRHQDVLGRLGGEEFAIFLPDTPLAEAQLVAERLRQACAQDVVQVEKERVRYTLSIGLTLFQGTEASDGVLRRADDAMYQAKRAGRDRVVTLVDAVGSAPRAVASSG